MKKTFLILTLFLAILTISSYEKADILLHSLGSFTEKASLGEKELSNLKYMYGFTLVKQDYTVEFCIGYSNTSPVDAGRYGVVDVYIAKSTGPMTGEIFDTPIDPTYINWDLVAWVRLL